MFDEKRVSLENITNSIPTLNRILLSSGKIKCCVINKYLMSVIICTILAGVGSEYLQVLLTNGRRKFDIYDIVTNITGSLLGVLLSYVLESR